MNRAARDPSDLTLILDDSFADSHEMSSVLLARADLDGTLQLLTPGWERALGYGRGELRGKTLRELMGSERLSAAAAAAILDKSNTAPVDVTVRCGDGRAKCLRLHCRYSRHKRVVYIVAEERIETRLRSAA